MLLLCLGVLGEYLGRVYDEVRSRPLSIISTVHRSPAMIAPQLGIVAGQANTDHNQDAIDAA
jgi:dolichol-phosphate mannosyltransferase